MRSVTYDDEQCQTRDARDEPAEEDVAEERLQDVGRPVGRARAAPEDDGKRKGIYGVNNERGGKAEVDDPL
jgi:hypothetical protein